MEELIIYAITVIAVYFLYLFFVIKNKKGIERFSRGTEMLFLKKRYKLNIEKVGITKLAHLIAVANAFIVANTVAIIMLIENFILMVITGFLILIPTILIVYHLIGKYYQIKQGKK